MFFDIRQLDIHIHHKLHIWALHTRDTPDTHTHLLPIEVSAIVCRAHTCRASNGENIAIIIIAIIIYSRHHCANMECGCAGIREHVRTHNLNVDVNILP